MKRITIKDIAREAGVSTALVSFVMNGKGKEHRVSERMIEHIQAVAKKLDYLPNASARALRSGKTNTIGVIVSDISNPFFSEIVRCIEDLAFAKGWSVLFGSTDEHPAKMERLIHAIQNKGVDGWIIVPSVGAESILEPLVQTNVPIVLLERKVPGLDLPFVCLDNVGAITQAVRHLMDQDYRRIHLLTYELPILSLLDRERAYVSEMRAQGLAEGVKVHRLPFKLPVGTNNAQYIASMLPLLAEADALICITARLSIMSLRAFQAAGLRLPLDIGFVGFDANDSFDLVGQSVTHIKQYPQVFGQKAFALLSERLEQTEIERLEHSDTASMGAELTADLILGTTSMRRGEAIGTAGRSLKDKFVQSIHLHQSGS